MKRAGFTLIELLIVVAIIAILAAIAIPNFLQAQVRAKVSRVYSDMRSVATGLEAYYVDNNAYPMDYTQMGAGIDANAYYYLYRLTVLTTPIAYLTSVPQDAFATSATDHPILRLPYCIPGTTELESVLTFDFAKKDLSGVPDNWITGDINVFNLIADNTLVMPGMGSQLMWVLRSPGPDNVSTPLGYWEHSEYGSCIVYDPTNGTTSWGEIMRSNLAQH